VYYLAHRHELRKGLYVFSRVNGVGKTFILDLIRDHDNAERKAMLSNRFTKKFVCEELVNINYDEDRSRRKEIKRTGLNWDDRYRHFYFDDLGKEVPTRYDRQELMGLIIGNLHRSFANRKLNLISSFTSNLHPEDREFVERYGAHVASRINEMCVVIEIKGEDQRR
jgi:predicted ATPase